MNFRYDRVLRVSGLVPLVAVAVALTACRAPGGVRQTAVVTGDWDKTFPLDPTGKVDILNPAGAITVDTWPQPSVEVHAERVAHGTTEQIARNFLTHIAVQADATPAAITLQPEPIQGVFIGVHFEVNYRVRMPSSAALHVRTGNGDVTVTGVGGHVSVTDSNGNIVGRLIGSGFDARNTNGRIDVEIARPTDDPIELRAVNGGIVLTLPTDMNANLSAQAVRGESNVTGLKFEPFGDTSGRRDRRLRGRINAGGTPIELNTVNGEIRVRAHE